MSGPVACLAIDPPWLERGGGKSTRGAQRHYSLMSSKAIRELLTAQLSSNVCYLPLLDAPPPIQVADDAHCWMWTTTNYLPDALDIMKAIGFRYVRSLVWVKVKQRTKLEIVTALKWHGVLGTLRSLLQIGLGQYLRGAHEVCLLGVRGRAMVPPPENRMPDVIFAQRTKHSRKPDEAFDVFELVSPGPRLEMFAREARKGWDCWGNEAPGATGGEV